MPGAIAQLLRALASGSRQLLSGFARRFPKTAAALGLGGAAVALTDGRAIVNAALLIGAAWLAGKWALENLA